MSGQISVKFQKLVRGVCLLLFIPIQNKVSSRSALKNYGVKKQTKQTWKVFEPNNDISGTQSQAEMK